MAGAKTRLVLEELPLEGHQVAVHCPDRIWTSRMSHCISTTRCRTRMMDSAKFGFDRSAIIKRTVAHDGDSSEVGLLSAVSWKICGFCKWSMQI